MVARHRQVPASASRPYGGPDEVRRGIGPSHSWHRERAAVPSQGESVHGRRALSDDRPGSIRGRGGGLQHSSRGGSQPLFRVGVPYRIHVSSVQKGVYQQSHDAQALRGVRIRGQGFPDIQPRGLCRHRDTQEDGGRRGLEVSGAFRCGEGRRRHRRRSESRRHVQERFRCSPRRSTWPRSSVQEG